MLNVTNNSFMLSVVMFNVVKLSVMAPLPYILIGYFAEKSSITNTRAYFAAASFNEKSFAMST
jgi:hypothetical protein